MKALMLNLSTYESRNDGEGGGRSPSVLRLGLLRNCVQTDRKREGGREGEEGGREGREGGKQTDTDTDEERERA